jgi:uncharacterized protein (DUF58 family)
VKRTSSPKLGAYAGLAALGLLAALVLGRPELAVIATPFALVLFSGLVMAREPEILVALELDRERAVEGDIVTITIDLHARTRSSVSSFTSRCRTTSSSSTARHRSRCGLPGTRSGRSSSRLTAGAGARTLSASSSCVRTIASTSSATRARSTGGSR